jgi:hypothetical protein
VAHDLVGKPVSTFPDHALGTARIRRNIAWPVGRPRLALIESIADAGFADDQQRLGRIGFDLLPQLAHQDAKILNVAGMRPPNVADQLLMGDHEPDMGRKAMQQGIFLARQLNAFAFERHHARHQIDR